MCTLKFFFTFMKGICTIAIGGSKKIKEQGIIFEKLQKYFLSVFLQTLCWHKTEWPNSKIEEEYLISYFWMKKSHGRVTAQKYYSESTLMQAHNVVLLIIQSLSWNYVCR